MGERKSYCMDMRKKKGLQYLITGFGCILSLYILIILALIFGSVGNPVTGTGQKELEYIFGYHEEGAVVPPDTEFFIPAIVNEEGDLAFSENELNEIASFCQHTENSYHGPINVSYINSPDGMMISIRPLENPGSQDICMQLKKENYTGKFHTLSPVLSRKSSIFSRLDLVPESDTLKIYINESVQYGTSLDIYVRLAECGYDPQDPYVCKGYNSILESQTYEKKRGYIPVSVGEFGTLNHLRQRNPLLWPVDIVTGA